MSEAALIQEYRTAGADLAAAAVAATFIPTQPVMVTRVAVVMTVGGDGTAKVLTINHQRAGGAALNPTGAAEGGTMTVPVSAAVGTGYYKDLTAPIIVLPGEQLAVASDGGGAAGTATIGIQYEPLSFVNGPARNRQISTTPGATVAPNYLSLMTEVTT